MYMYMHTLKILSVECAEVSRHDQHKVNPYLPIGQSEKTLFNRKEIIIIVHKIVHSVRVIIVLHGEREEPAGADHSDAAPDQRSDDLQETTDVKQWGYIQLQSLRFYSQK